MNIVECTHTWQTVRDNFHQGPLRSIFCSLSCLFFFCFAFYDCIPYIINVIKIGMPCDVHTHVACMRKHSPVLHPSIHWAIFDNVIFKNKYIWQKICNLIAMVKSIQDCYQVWRYQNLNLLCTYSTHIWCHAIVLLS